MKKIALSTALLISFCFSAQATGDLYIQNFSVHTLEYTIAKANQSNVAGNCSPSFDSKDSNGILKLPGSMNPHVTAVEALYKRNLNLSNTFNPSFPNTPLSNGWSLNGNTPPISIPLNNPSTSSPIPTFMSQTSDWAVIKFTVIDPTGVSLGGFGLGQTCGGALVPDLAAYPNAPVTAKWFTMGGATWLIID